MVERAALEMRYTRKRIEGSNPPLSAYKKIKLSVQVLLEQAVFIFLYARMPSADLGIRGGRAKRGRCPRIPTNNKTVCPSLLEQAVFVFLYARMPSADLLRI